METLERIRFRLIANCRIGERPAAGAKGVNSRVGAFYEIVTVNVSMGIGRRWFPADRRPKWPGKLPFKPRDKRYTIRGGVSLKGVFSAPRAYGGNLGNGGGVP
jgi:hypothetical protein